MNHSRPPILKTLPLPPRVYTVHHLISTKSSSGETSVCGIDSDQLREFMLWARELAETINTLTQHVAMLERQLEARGLIRLANDRHGDA